MIVFHESQSFDLPEIPNLLSYNFVVEVLGHLRDVMNLTESLAH